MNKFTIPCINGESISYSIDAELFSIQIKTIKLMSKVRSMGGWTDFFLFQLEAVKTRQAKLELIKSIIVKGDDNE